MDLAEMHPRNNLNLCLMGGMTELLSIIFSHESDQVRQRACSLLTSIMSNNRQVQEFASKSGAINLVSQFERETSVASKSSVFSCLTAWLKADNFEGKRRFIAEQDGLNFLMRLVSEAAADAAFDTRLKTNVHRLLSDLLVNDDGIFEERPEHVREHCSADAVLLGNFAAELAQTDVHKMRLRQVREPMLFSIFRMHQYKPDTVGPAILPALQQHKAAIEAVLADPEADPDLKESLADELARTQKAIEAPSLPFVRNFEQETEVESVQPHQRGRPGPAKTIHGLSLRQ